MTVSGGTVEDLSVTAEGPFVVDDDCGALADGQTCSIESASCRPRGSAGGQLVVESSTASNTAALEGRRRALHHRAHHHRAPHDGPIADDNPADLRPPTNVPPTNAPNTAVPPSSIPPTSAPVETREECDARALGARITYAPSLEMRVGESSRSSPAPRSATVQLTVGRRAIDRGGPQRCNAEVRARLPGGEDFTTNPEDWQEASSSGRPTSRGDGRHPEGGRRGPVPDPRGAGPPVRPEAGRTCWPAPVQQRLASGSRQSAPRRRQRLNDAVSVSLAPTGGLRRRRGLVVLFRWGQRRSKDVADTPTSAYSPTNPSDRRSALGVSVRLALSVT